METNAGHLYFFLPRLLEKGLIIDDSDHYVLTSYPPEVAQNSSLEIINHLRNGGNISLSSKKRIKFIMEAMGVALCFPVKESDNWKVAIDLYSKWIDDPSLFGDVRKQNNYLRKIIKQLSSPFNFRNMKENLSDNNDIFSSKAYPVLNILLDCYERLLRKRAKEMEKKTFLLLFNILIGICDSVQENKYALLEKLKVNFYNLQKKITDILFSTIYLYGIKDESIWKRLISFFQDWSSKPGIIEVWGEKIISIYSYICSTIMNLEKTKNPFEGGVFDSNNVITLDLVSYYFQNTIMVINIQTVANDPKLLNKISDFCESLINISMESARKASPFLTNRYPASNFLRLFGSFLTLCPATVGIEHEEYISKCIDSILCLVSHFSHDGVEGFIPKLLAFVAQKITPQSQLIIGSFLNRANELYEFNHVGITYYSELTIKFIPLFNISKAEKYNNIQFLNNLISLFISSIEILNSKQNLDNNIKNNINNAFNSLWTIVNDKKNIEWKIKYILMCISIKLNPIHFLNKVNEIFQDISSYMNEEGGIEFLADVLLLLSTSIRLIMEINGYISMVNTKIIETIVSSLKKQHQNPILIISTLSLFLSMIEWGQKLFQKEEVVCPFFEFITWVSSLSKEENHWKKDENELIKILNDTINARVNIHIQPNDYYTQKLDSSPDINENTIIKNLGITNAKIYSFTIGNKILVSFIEKPDGLDPLVLFIRGSFGKMVWKISDEYQGSLSDPKLSDEIKPSPLTKPTITEIKKLEMTGTPLENMPHIKMLELAKQDEQIRNYYEKDYTTWLNWNEYGFYPPFNQKAPYQRPRVIDFLTTSGLLDNHNRLEIRPQTNQQLLKSVKEEFDQLEKMNLNIIPLIHILNEDISSRYSPKFHQRMTVKLQRFLEEIGEPIIINDQSAQSRGIPPLRTPIPIFISSINSNAILCPAMAKDEKGSEKIYEMGQNSKIMIFFNESDFEIKLNNESDKILLIVKPTFQGMYFVKQVSTINGIITPFTTQQSISASTLMFYLSLCVEILYSNRIINNLVNIPQKRISLIDKLCDKPVIAELSAVALEEFTS